MDKQTLKQITMDILFSIFIFISVPLIFVFLVFLLLMFKIFTGKSINNPAYHPVKGTVFDQLFYFKTLFDYQTKVASKCSTFRLLAPINSEIYTTEPRNVEHFLKTNFDKYSKGDKNQDIMRDLFGHGIFVVDGEKWKQQRKLASFEFSTRVLRDFSCSIFRRNAAKLVRVVSRFSVADRVFDMQVSNYFHNNLTFCSVLNYVICRRN